MELNVIRNQKIFNEKGEVIYPNCKEVAKLPNNYYRIITTDNTHVLCDNNGNIVNNISVFYNSRGHVIVIILEKCYFLLPNFKLSENCFDDIDFGIGNTELVGVCIEDYWGFADINGKIKIPIKYRHAPYFSQNTDLPLIVKRDDFNYTFCNPKTGEEIYKDILHKVDHFRYRAELNQYVAQVSFNNKINFLKTDGTFLLPHFIDEIRIEDFGILVKDNGLYGLFGFEGNIIFNIEYESIFYNEKYNRFILKQNKKYGIASSRGFILVPCLYSCKIKMNKDLAILMKNNQFILYKIGVGEIFVPLDEKSITELTSSKILEEDYIQFLFNALSYYLN